MADMVEVKVKMYSCRLCGIRYDDMQKMKMHYRDSCVPLGVLRPPV